MSIIFAPIVRIDDAYATGHAKWFLHFYRRIIQLSKNLHAVFFKTSQIHVTSLSLTIFARPLLGLMQRSFFNALKPSRHLNTVIFFTFLMIPQLFVINYRFQSANTINSKRILSLCEFLSHPVKPHFAVFFLQ